MNEQKRPDPDKTAGPRPRASAPPDTSESASTRLESAPKPEALIPPPQLATETHRRRRYRTGKVLGRGGMGEVRVALDQRVGRSVAIKVMLTEAAERSDSRRRFLREARVQGQLEHPSIVPVYDLGWDREGRAYFAMKRVSGVTLGEVLRELRKRNPEFEAKYSLRKLLLVFQQVCLAVEYAHARGVVHRDLKPNNLMLGDFGEVYVLDWGIAKVQDAADSSSATLRLAAHDDGSDSTRQDEVLGTIGFMAPEQLDGASAVDSRADVYSLGAVLFQLVTLEPLHGYGNAAERARSTQVGADARPSRRAPYRNVPPELDGICEKATALDPAGRYPSARALHDALEAFLEGDRDMRLRSELAEQHVETARAALFSLARDGAEATDRRKRALREAGRALALDPQHEAAANIVARLLLEPPKEMPAEVQAETEATLRSEMRRGVRMAAIALLGLAAYATFLPLTGETRSWPFGVGILVALFVTAAYAYVASRHDDRLREHLVVLTIPLCVAIALISGILGPLVLAPTVAIAFVTVVAISHWLGRYRVVMIALPCASWAVPAVLEWAGVLPPAYRFDGGTMEILPGVTELSETFVRGGLFGLNLTILAAVSAMLWRYASWVAESRERQRLYAWHLEQLAPSERDPREARRDEPHDVSDATRG